MRGRFVDATIKGGPDDGRAIRIEVREAGERGYDGFIGDFVVPVRKRGNEFLVDYQEDQAA